MFFEAESVCHSCYTDVLTVVFITHDQIDSIYYSTSISVSLFYFSDLLTVIGGY